LSFPAWHRTCAVGGLRTQGGLCYNRGMDKKLLALALSVLTLCAEAASATAERAVRSASALAARRKAAGAAPTGDVRTFTVDGKDAFHLVAIAGGGFAAYAACDVAGGAMLGFTERGRLPDAADGSPLWEMIADAAGAAGAGGRRAKAGGASRRRFGVRPEVVPLQRIKAGDSRYKEDASLLDDVRVMPILGSKWDQGDVGARPCYNYYTPNNYLCGCVATAMSQVMRFHEWPRGDVAQFTRICSEGGEDGLNGSPMKYLTTKGGAFDWANMPLDPASEANLSEAKRQAIGKLCYDTGVSVSTAYASVNGSSMAWSEFAFGPFTEVFGYASAHSMFYLNPDDWAEIRPLTDEQLQSTLLANLDAGLPCVVGVGGDGSEHAVVGDGYGYLDGELFCHLECGWSGSHDFWFLAPENSYSHIIGGFTVYTVSYNIFEDAEHSLVTGRVLDTAGNAVSNATVTAVVEEGGAVVFSTNVTTSAFGVYAVRAPASACTVSVWAEGEGLSSRTNGVSVFRCESVEVYDYYDFDCYGENVCGNSWGNDLVLGGGSAAQPLVRPSGIDAAGSDVVVRVVRADGASGALRGELRLYGSPTPSPGDFGDVGASVVNGDFSQGPEAVLTFPKDGRRFFFAPVVVGP